MKKENIALLQTKDGDVLKWEDIQKLDKISDTDIIITYDDIKELVKTEMDEACHTDYIENYDSELDFYLSSAAGDNYPKHIQYALDHKGKINNELAVEIQLEVEKEIRNKCL